MEPLGRGAFGVRLFLILAALALVFGALSLSGKPIRMPVWVVVEVENRLNAAVSEVLPEASVSVAQASRGRSGGRAGRSRG